MFIHLGNNITVSDKKCVGVFNIETLKLSDDNRWIISGLSEYDKLICVTDQNDILTSNVSPFTVIKRKSFIKDELIWSKE